MSYERVYSVGLLDDLHNYFPRILYRPEQFNNFQEILSYVQAATQRRFNLFDHGRRLYEDSSVPLPRNTHIRMEEADFVPILRAFINVPTRVTRTTGINSLFQDVIVNASQDLIENASTQITLEEDLDIGCSVCQDDMRQGELIRKLNVCGHMFHISCVDTWFLNESVLCPTCRHDIRQPRRISPVLTSTHETPSTNSERLPEITENVTTPPATTRLPVLPPAPSRVNLRQRGSDTQDLLNAIFNIRQY